MWYYSLWTFKQRLMFSCIHSSLSKVVVINNTVVYYLAFVLGYCISTLGHPPRIEIFSIWSQAWMLVVPPDVLVQTFVKIYCIRRLLHIDIPLTCELVIFHISIVWMSIVVYCWILNYLWDIHKLLHVQTQQSQRQRK